MLTKFTKVRHTKYTDAKKIFTSETRCCFWFLIDFWITIVWCISTVTFLRLFSLPTCTGRWIYTCMPCVHLLLWTLKFLCAKFIHIVKTLQKKKEKIQIIWQLMCEVGEIALLKIIWIHTNYYCTLFLLHLTPEWLCLPRTLLALSYGAGWSKRAQHVS